MATHERALAQQQAHQDAEAPLAALAVAAATASSSPPPLASLSLDARAPSAQTAGTAMSVQTAPTEPRAPAADAPRDASATHHATNLLHEAVEREQKLREDSARQQRTRDADDTESDGDSDDALERELDAAPLQDIDPQSIPVVRNSSPETVQPEATQYGEDVRNKNIPDLYYLFTNDKLKEEPLTKVLHSDPFVIPRLTDNVPEYRPAFNPLSILEGEEKLLPRYFRLDPYEGIPGVSGGAGTSSKGAKGDHGRSHHDKSARDRASMAGRSKTAASGSSSSSGSSTSAGPFVGKTSTFMGTLPRQSEFSEIPVADAIFQPQPPPPPAPHPSYASKNLSILRSAKDWSDSASAASASASAQQSQQQQSASATSAPSVASTLSSNAPVTPTALTDAMFLTSLHHQSGAEQQQQQMPPYARNDYAVHSYYGSSATEPTGAQQPMYHQSPPGAEREPAAGGDKLTRYLPARSPASSSSMYDDVYLSGDPQPQLSYAPAATPYSASMYSDYRDSAMTDPASLPGTAYDYTGLPQHQALQQQQQQQTTGAGGDTQSLQPISKKPRSKNVFRPCTAPGCTKGARGKSGLCQKHGGGKRCAMPNCAKGAQGSSTMCLFHGGGYRCTVDGCTTGARGTSGLCAKHGGYKRSASGGKDASGRTSGSASPTGSHTGGGSGKRARTQQHSPMDFDANGASAGAGVGPVTPRFESMLFG